MSQVNVSLVRADTNQEFDVELPDDARIAELLPALVKELGLPVTGPDGNQVAYELSNKRTGREYAEGTTLGEAGTLTGDLLLLTSTFVAGAKPPKVGGIITTRKLRNMYGKCSHIVSTLGPKLDQQPREKRGAVRRYKVIEELPTAEQYRELRAKRFTTTLGELLEDAYSQAETVGEELREWYDNLPEAFQEGDKGERLNEAADVIENAVCEKPSDPLPDAIAELPVVFIPGEPGSRAATLCEAADMMTTVQNELERLGELPEHAAHHEAMSETRDTLDNAVSELQGVEVPGMYD